MFFLFLKTTTELDLKEAQRFFAQKFSCGASVTGEDEIIIQGDFTDDIIDVIQERWPEVSAGRSGHFRSDRVSVSDVTVPEAQLSVFFRWMMTVSKILEK